MRRAATALLALAMGALAAAGAAGQARDVRGGAESSPVLFWASVGDPDLEALILRALDGNPHVRAAEARVRGARAGRTHAALDLAPAVTASGGYSRQRLASATIPGVGGSLPGQDLWDAGLHLSWELDAFGRGRRLLDARGALLASAEEDVGDVRVLLAAEVARAYFDLRGTQDRLAVARRNADNQRRTLEVTRERLEAGRGTELDSERARAQLASTLAAIPALESTLAAAEHRIGALLGEPPGSAAPELRRKAPPLDLPPIEAAVAAEEAIEARPDLRSAERRVEASGALVDAARADYFPRISIGGGVGYTATAFDALGASGTPRYAVGPVISWPLFDIGRVRAGVDAARAGEAEARARYRSATLAALEEAETSLVTYRKARERLGHLEEAAAASERATELARLRYEEGATGFLEVLDAERTQLEAQDRLAAGRTDAAAGLVAVYRAFGGRWPAP